MDGRLSSSFNSEIFVDVSQHGAVNRTKKDRRENHILWCGQTSEVWTPAGSVQPEDDLALIHFTPPLWPLLYSDYVSFSGNSLLAVP